MAVRKAREKAYDFFRRNVGEKNASQNIMTSANSAMRTSAFCKTFLKSFCAGLLRVLAQAPLTRECEGGKPSQTSGYPCLGVTKKNQGVGQTAPKTRDKKEGKCPLFIISRYTSTSLHQPSLKAHQMSNSSNH